LHVLIGAWKAFPTFAVLGGLGVLIGVAYILRAIQKAFFSNEDEEEGREETAERLDPISVPERIGAALLIAITLGIGLYPKVLLDLIGPAVDSPLLGNLLREGSR